jgi:hypothetical protein
MARRSKKTWEMKFKCVQKFMSVMDTMGEDEELIECCATMLRNPVVFDNNVKEVKNVIPYKISGLKGKLTEDHLIGMSNMVLYMFKNGIHKKWNNVQDFKNTMKSLNVLLPVTKEMNDNGTFKGWQFKSNNINECIKWNSKLKSVGVTELVCEKTGKKVSVDEAWSTWFEENKTFLV